MCRHHFAEDCDCVDGYRKQPTQLPKRPLTTLGRAASALEVIAAQDAKIAELEKELKVYKRALEMACSGSVKIMPDVVDQWIEAARKEQG
jgi:hypothetical protein